jgi:hypothetical protein
MNKKFSWGNLLKTGLSALNGAVNGRMSKISWENLLRFGLKSELKGEVTTGRLSKA